MSTQLWFKLFNTVYTLKLI